MDESFNTVEFIEKKNKKCNIRLQREQVRVNPVPTVKEKPYCPLKRTMMKLIILLLQLHVAK